MNRFQTDKELDTIFDNDLEIAAMESYRREIREAADDFVKEHRGNISDAIESCFSIDAFGNKGYKSNGYLIDENDFLRGVIAAEKRDPYSGANRENQISRYTHEEIKKTSCNLAMLADYIEENVPQKMLNMKTFFSKSGVDTKISKAYKFDIPNECGTSACALGWEFQRIGAPLNEFSNWHDLSDSQFPALSRWRTGDNVLGSFCFSPYESSEKSQVIERLRMVSDELNSGVN